MQPRRGGGSRYREAAEGGWSAAQEQPRGDRRPGNQDRPAVWEEILGFPKFFYYWGFRVLKAIS